MPKPQSPPMPLLQGTLDMLILRTLIFGPRHGHAIAVTIERTSDEDLLIDHGSLYPALQRLEEKGWIQSEWKATDQNRPAKYYELTRAGRRALKDEAAHWRRYVDIVDVILGTN
jgi:PadR family transcriptional regulator, regulatory protein PadR